MKLKPIERYYTRAETAEILGVSIATLDRYTRTGVPGADGRNVKLKCHRVGRLVKFTLIDINEFMHETRS